MITIRHALCARNHLAIFQALGDKDGVARVLNNLGTGAYYQGDYKRADSLYRESLELFRGLGAGYEVGVMYAVMNLAHTAQRLGNLQQARASYLEALALGHETHSPYATADH